MTKVIFLDRDGTINVESEKGYVDKISEWQFTPQAPEALTTLQAAGYALVVITNQSGIARRLYTEEDMNHLHEHMEEQLAKEGVKLAAVAFCPHDRNSICDCRKPNIGMAQQIEQKIGAIDYANSWTIGDKVADIGFGKNAGTKTALIRSKFWSESDVSETPDMIVDSLYDFARRII